MPAVDKRPAALRVLVVDDESLARRNLVVLLRRDPEVASIAECASGVEAVDAMRRERYDLVFLDVQMPECDGFDVLEMLGGDVPPAIVFVTAYQDYALRAFDAGALDYLLKPFDDARFGRALHRAREKIARHARDPAPQAARLVVKDRGRVLFVDADDVDWIEAAGYYACLHTGAATHLLRRSMSELERDLGDAKFVRIHRSAIVNVGRIRALELDAGGEYEVVLKSNARLRLSRRLRKALQERLGLLAGTDDEATAGDSGRRDRAGPQEA
jgi:two-component system LytT family response regulator